MLRPLSPRAAALRMFEPASVYGGRQPIVFSATAQAVYNAGLALWRYYHAQPGVDVNASLYDIRVHFQGRKEGGKMNSKSADEGYNGRIGALRQALQLLADKIAPKVYEHRFLKGIALVVQGAALRQCWITQHLYRPIASARATRNAINNALLASAILSSCAPMISASMYASPTSAFLYQVFQPPDKRVQNHPTHHCRPHFFHLLQALTSSGARKASTKSLMPGT